MRAFRAILVVILLVAANNLRADMSVTTPLQLSSFFADSACVAIAFVKKAECVSVRNMQIDATVHLDMILRGSDTAGSSLELRTSWGHHFDVEECALVGERVLTVYTVRDGRRYGVFFPMKHEGDLGFIIQKYFEILNGKDAAEKKAAFLTFAKAELTAPNSHPVVLLGIATQLQAGSGGVLADKEFRKKFEELILKAARHDRTYVAEAFCRTLEAMQSKHTAEAFVALTQRPQEAYRPALCDVVARNEKVREAFKARLLVERNEENLGIQIVRFSFVEAKEKRKIMREVWSKNEAARKDLVSILKQSDEDLLEELQGTE